MKSGDEFDGSRHEEVPQNTREEGDVERDDVDLTGYEKVSSLYGPDSALVKAVTMSFNEAIREKPRLGHSKLDWQRAMFFRNMVFRLGGDTPSLESVEQVFYHMVDYLKLRDDDEDESVERGEGRCISAEQAASFCRLLQLPPKGTWMMEQEAAAYCRTTGETIRMWEAEGKNGVKCRVLINGPDRWSYQYWIAEPLAGVGVECQEPLLGQIIPFPGTK